MRSSGVLKLTVTSPVQTFTEPLTIAEIKTYLRLPAGTAQDDLIESMIQSAREFAELFQGRDVVAKQYDLTLDNWRGEIGLRDHLATVDAVTYKNEDGTVTTMAENTDYIVDTVRGLIQPPVSGSWPSVSLWPSSAITIRFTVAPPAPDQMILNGMRYLVASWFEGRLPFVSVAEGSTEVPFAITAAFNAGKSWSFA